MRGRGTVVVVGSANVDVVVRTTTLPQAGETVLGAEHSEHAGGKGLNQAVAAAKSATTYFVGALGRDPQAETLREALERNGVHTTGVVQVNAPSGRAFVTVNSAGENQIVVVPGANHRLRTGDVLRTLDKLQPTLVVLQLEIPSAVVQAASTWAAERGTRVVMNASPITAEVLDGRLRAALAIADPLIVNAGEARALTGDGHDASDWTVAVALSRTARSVIMTRGSEGALVAKCGVVNPVPQRTAKVVDTTGAGDVFAGTVAAELACDRSLAEAAAAAADAAAYTVEQTRSERAS